MSWFKKENNNILGKPELPDLPNLNYDSQLSSISGIKPVSQSAKSIILPEDMSPINPLKKSLPELPPLEQSPKIQGMQKSKFDTESDIPDLPKGTVSNFGIDDSLPELNNYEPPKFHR